MPSVSVVIPTKNGEKTIGGALKSIFQQQAPEKPEVIIIDSGSQDQTLTIAKQYPVRIITIPPHDFNHGATRNQGIRNAGGEIVLLITQDAEPVNHNWLRSMMKKFSDPQVAGVYCRQIPRDDADVITRRRLNEWLTGRKEHSVNKIENRSHYEALPPMEKYLFCNFDNVCSAIRKTVWEKMPFEKTSFAEDIGWSKKVLEAGYAIVYEPKAAVYHSHNRSIWYEYQRTCVCHQRLYQLFGLRTIPSFKNACQATLKNIAFESSYVWQKEKNIFSRCSLLLKLPLLSLFSVFGQYLGARRQQSSYK